MRTFFCHERESETLESRKFTRPGDVSRSLPRPGKFHRLVGLSNNLLTALLDRWSKTPISSVAGLLDCVINSSLVLLTALLDR
mgnify:CR=1 FL=1